jgi:hypothetical protein
MTRKSKVLVTTFVLYLPEDLAMLLLMDKFDGTTVT